MKPEFVVVDGVRYYRGYGSSIEEFLKNHGHWFCEFIKQEGVFVWKHFKPRIEDAYRERTDEDFPLEYNHLKNNKRLCQKYGIATCRMVSLRDILACDGWEKYDDDLECIWVPRKHF